MREGMRTLRSPAGSELFPWSATKKPFVPGASRAAWSAALKARLPVRPATFQCPLLCLPMPGPGHRRTYTAVMIRWFLVVFLALMFISWLSPLLRRMGFGRLPGDFRFRWLGREWDVPLASTLLLSFAVSLIVKWL